MYVTQSGVQYSIQKYQRAIDTCTRYNGWNYDNRYTSK